MNPRAQSAEPSSILSLGADDPLPIDQSKLGVLKSRTEKEKTSSQALYLHGCKHERAAN